MVAITTHASCHECSHDVLAHIDNLSVVASHSHRRYDATFYAEVFLEPIREDMLVGFCTVSIALRLKDVTTEQT